MSDDDINKEENAAENSAETPKKELRVPKYEDLQEEDTKPPSDEKDEKGLRIPKLEDEVQPITTEPSEKKLRVPTFEDENKPEQTEEVKAGRDANVGSFEEIQKYMPQDSKPHEEEKPFQDFSDSDEGEDTSSDDDADVKKPSFDDMPEEAPATAEELNPVQATQAEELSETDTEEAQGEGEEGLRTAPEPSSNEQEINYVTSDVIDLKIGDDIGLTNKDPTLKKVRIGAGWEIRSLEGDAPDVDLCCFILNKDDQTRKDADFVFYNNKQSEEGELQHKGDSRTGAGEGDDEMVDIDLQAFPFEVASIMFTLSIHDGEVNEQDFSMMKDVFLRVINADTHQELCKLVIPDKFLEEKKGHAMKVGKIFRDGPKWRFHGCTEVYPKGGLRKVATEYGIIIV